MSSSRHDNDFDGMLKFGRLAESEVTSWLITRGYTILTMYEVEQDTGKGPRLFRGGGNLISPDILGIKDGAAKWFEVKHRTSFVWFRKTQEWRTGIHRREFDAYLAVAKFTPWPVFIFFLQREAASAPGAPGMCPTGLFYGELRYLLDNRITGEQGSQRSGRYDPQGMYYWTDTTLRHLASLQEVERAHHSRKLLHGDWSGSGAA